MMLYDIFYPDGTFDPCGPLPEITDRTKPERAEFLREILAGATARCVNWDGHSVAWNGDDWE